MRIGIVGNGVVGNATAAALEPMHEVLRHDIDLKRAVHSMAEVTACDLIIVCLPTPRCVDSLACDVSIVADFFAAAPKDRNYVLRSTVPIGTTKWISEQFGILNMVHWPEFLTARTAVDDADNPARNVIGIPPAKQPVEQNAAFLLRCLLLERWPDVFVFQMSSDESEMVKLVQNAFSAVKIAFFNEARTLADARNLDWQRVMNALLASGWINWMHTQVPGPDGKRGFGGACLPKDLANWIDCLSSADLRADVAEAALARNLEDRER